MQIQKRTEKRNLFLIYFGTISSLIGDEIGSVAISIWVALQTDNPINFALVYSAKICIIGFMLKLFLYTYFFEHTDLSV